MDKLQLANVRRFSRSVSPVSISRCYVFFYNRKNSLVQWSFSTLPTFARGLAAFLSTCCGENLGIVKVLDSL